MVHPKCSRPLSTLLLGLVAGCVTKAEPVPTVIVDGSSTVFPITDAVAISFQKREPVKVALKIPVGVSGTGGGFRKFCAGKTDISDASRPINAEEAEVCAKNGIEYLELPIAYDGLAVLVNPKNTWANDITTAELKRIWEPKAEHEITKWSQVRVGWPDKDLHLYGAGADSGTYDYFSEAIVHEPGRIRSDFKASEDDDLLVQDVSRDELALGFFGYAYYYKNQSTLKALAVDDGDPKNGDGPVAPSSDAVRTGTYQPLSRPLFIYVSKASLARREVDLFVHYYLAKCAGFAGRIGYVPLPEKAYQFAQQRVLARRTGSLFHGDSLVGMSIEELLQREQDVKPGERVGAR